MVKRIVAVAVLVALPDFWLAGSHATASATGLVAVAALILAGMLSAFVAHSARIAAAVTARPLTGRVAALRRKSWCAAFQRQLNPAAAGNARPRAPSAVPAAA